MNSRCALTGRMGSGSLWMLLMFGVIVDLGLDAIQRIGNGSSNEF